MLRPLVLVLALVLIAPASAAAAPPITVAGVGAVEEAQLEHWMDVAEASSAGGSRSASRVQVVELLTSFLWVEGEAADRGMVVTRAEVDEGLEEQKARSFESEEDFEQYLRESRMTVADLRLRVRGDLLSAAIREHVLAPVAAGVTETDIDAYIAAHPPEQVPERRDLQVVLTRTRATAVRAYRELRAGRRFSKVARRYSIDEATRDNGGRLGEATREQLGGRLGNRVFAARRGQLLRPTRTRFGWFVVRIQRIRPPYTEPLTREVARDLVVMEAETEALGAFVRAFREKWRARTACAPGWTAAEACGTSGQYAAAS